MIDMELTNSKEGCRLGDTIFLGALFADDLGVVSTSRNGLDLKRAKGKKYPKFSHGNGKNILHCIARNLSLHAF